VVYGFVEHSGVRSCPLSIYFMATPNSHNQHGLSPNDHYAT
jgi:hypothetical protein